MSKVVPNAPKQEGALADKEKRPIDPRIMNGPIVERSCTDIVCLVLFVASIAVMWWIAATGYENGKPERLVAAYDPDKKACGLDYSDYPYIYFPILHPDYYNHTVCVKECPHFGGMDFPSALDCQPNRLIKSCQRNCFNFDFSDSTSLKNFPPLDYNIADLVCIISTEMFMDRLCFPTEAINLLNQTSNFSQAVDVNRMSAWLNDLKVAWAMILGSFFIAFVLGMLYMVFVRFFAGIIVWIAIIGYFVALIILAAFCYTQSQQYYTKSNQSANPEDKTNASDTAQTLEILSYCIFAIWGLSLILFFCIFNKIRLAIAVIKTAAIFVRDEFLIILVPPVIALCTGILWVWWIISAIYVVSLGKIEGSGSTPFATVEWDDETRRMFWYWVFGGLWKNAFLQAICSFIIASTCSIWYFSQGSGMTNHFAISTSIYRTFRYHLGSLAFGSLILAIVQFIRIILEYVRYQMKSMGAGENKVTKCLLDYLRCIMACFERFIRFLTRNTYIQIAITGKSFCPAAKEAFETIFANSMRFTLVGGIGSVFTLIGKLLITILTVMIAYLVLIHDPYYQQHLFSPILPCVIIFIIAYTVSVLFMSIYGMACDTVLMCYIYDEDLNKQTGGGSAQHCPETLREFFEVHG